MCTFTRSNTSVGALFFSPTVSVPNARIFCVVSLLAFALLLVPLDVRAEEVCEPVVGRLVSVEGSVEVQRTAGGPWRALELDQPLCQGDTIRVGGRSRAAVALVNDAVLRLDQNTTVSLLNIIEEEEERSLLSLIAGALQSFSRRPRQLAIDTPYLNASIEGTEFVVRVEENRSLVTVLEGRVAAANDIGRLLLASGESAVAEAGQAPRSLIVVRPRDAVQWALHYPPILAVLADRAGLVPAEAPANLRQALERFGRGDVGGAFASLDEVPEAERDATFHLFRSAMLLSVGRVEEARAGVDRAIALEPGAGLAFALRAVIGVVRNENAQALADGRRGVELSPRVAAPKIALSYAQQANFQLEAARDTLLQAVEEQPGDALAWARLAELWLSLGFRDQALEAANRATALTPELERTQTVLGFAALAAFDTGTARAAFERAIALDSASPLPHLGLGLAKINRGNLPAGRKDIEVAIALDSSNALLRAYLGKAYFDEKRAPLDGEQFAIAKELDPSDPTAYFYDAIRKQTENEPGEALEDLQAAIERNDNRAVYRGRLQLDEDRAARGTSLARIYDDLGFGQLGINESTRSLTLDPANASAHRFLSDSYRGVRRREISRVSELLQAQMLQDININPVQPSISETNLNIVAGGGPTEPGFNEFTPLFERNRAQLSATGVVGDNDTLGGEAVVSGVYNRFSLSAGAFRYESEGFRPNNDLEHDIFNIYAQAALTPQLNVQAEFRQRETEEGDLALNFDPNQFLLDKTRTLDQEVARAGLRFSPLPSSDLLVSFIHADRDEKLHQTEAVDIPPFGTFDVTTDARFEQEGYVGEAQHLYRRDWLNTTAGLALGRFDNKLTSQITFAGFPFPPETTVSDIDHRRGYLYANVNLPEPVTWTLGVSYDDYEEEALKRDQWNPKFGAQWDITEALRLRGAAFRTIKPALVANQTLEPTQIAGFNQFFDDVNAAETEGYGVGLDANPTRDLSVGAEATWRDLDDPVFFDSTVVFEERNEQLHRLYLYWTPVPELALSAQLVYDRYKSPTSLDPDLPRKVKTVSVPLTARYFHPSGLFVGVGATYVDQEVNRDALSTLADGSDDFVVVDASIGYRLPKRYGMVSLGVWNLLDEDFMFQDDSFREFRDEPSIGPYIPDRTILARITLSF